MEKENNIGVMARDWKSEEKFKKTIFLQKEKWYLEHALLTGQ